jgi:plastocyanin
MGHTRRAVLGSAAAITTGLAGCTGSQDGGDGGEAGDGEDGESGPTPTATPDPTPDPTPTDTATAAPTTGADETVVVGPNGDLVFDPAELDVDVGTTVRWRWDSGGHTVTVESQPNGAGWTATGQQTHSSGYTHTHTFEVAGTYEYVCLPHESAGMVGSVVVGDVGTPTSESGATVRVRDHPDLGEILVGPDGRTLYMFDRDARGDGSSSCSGDCAGAWPPLTVEEEPTAGDGVTADLTTFEREDGTTQVAAAGWPLYYFADDGEPGEANGQGAGGVWWVLGPGGTPKRPEATSTPTASPTPTPTSDGGDPY